MKWLDHLSWLIAWWCIGGCALQCEARPAVEKKLEGTVVDVHDGDTAKVLSDDNKKYSIRLWGIDAPELNQPYGEQARKALCDMILNKEVVVTYTKHDRYRRIIGVIFVPEANFSSANLNMVENGHAWHYVKYTQKTGSSACAIVESLQMNAQKQKLGLWATPDPIAPWDWRHSKK